MLATPGCPSSKILIYNSPGNMHFIARYMACAMARTPYCYFQDDDWMIQHLRSMYANFLRFPHLVHTDTNADVYSLTNWKWCFYHNRKYKANFAQMRFTILLTTFQPMIFILAFHGLVLALLRLARMWSSS
jgi:hypothetical protein